MKKKLSLLMIALVAITAFAVQVSRRVAADVADVATLNALADKAEFTFKGQVSVVAKIAKGDNTYCYVQDATGSTLIYANKDNKDKVAALEVGKKIAADWTGTVSIYNKLFEAVPASVLAVTEDATVAPTIPEVAITDVTEANVNKIVKLTDVTIFGFNGSDFKIQKGELTVAGYDQFGIKGANFANGLVCSEVIGAIGRYNDAIQFQPISYTVGTPAPDPADLVVSPETGADITAALSEANAAATVPVKNITINLAANGEYTVSAPIESSAGLTIAGPAELGNGNAPVIDASANTGSFVRMATPVVAANAKNFYEVDNFAIKNVVVKNINSYVYDDNKKAFAFAEFAIENCVFEFNNTKQDIDCPFRFQAGGPVKFVLKNNTMYQKGTKNNKYFVKISSGNFPDKAFATFDGPYVWDIENNTFYQTIAHGGDSKMEFLNGGRVSNNFAKTSITILKNIIVDCAGSDSFLKNLFGGKSSDGDREKFVAINTDYNTYWTDGAAIDVSKYDKGENTIAADPQFKDAANGDFALALTGAQNVAKTGDPRWIQYSVTIADGIENGSVVADLAAAKAGDVVTLTATPADGYMLDKWDVKQGETAVAVKDNKFTMPAGDVTVGATFRVAPVDVEIAATDITEGKLTDAIVAKAAGKPIKNLTVTLAENTAYTVTASIEAGGNVTITGAAGATIDASALSGAFIQMSTTPAVGFQPKNDDSGNTDYYGVDNVTIKDVKVTGLKNSIFYDNNTKYVVLDFTMNNSVFELATEAVKNEALISFQAGGAKDFTVKNSTIYGNNAVAKYFLRYNNSSRIDRYGFVGAEDTWSFTYENNTFYGLLKSDGQWGNYNGVSQKTGQLVLTVKNNIWVNCDAQTMRRLNHSKNFSNFNAASAMSGNIFNREGAVVDQGSYGNGSDINGIVTFTEAATGNFNAELGLATAPATETTAIGDPRWTVTNKQIPFDVEISPAEGDIAAALTAATEGKLVKNITINLTKDVTYTVGATLIAPYGITINGNGATIDASALEANLIEFAAKAAEDTEWTNANVSISGVTVKGLKKALFFSNSKYYYGDFSLINSVVEQAGDAITFDYTKGSVAVNFTVTGSTIYAPTATTKSLYSSQGGQKATEYKDDATQSFAFLLNTMYNLAPTKNFFSHRQSNQKWLAYGVHSNIFVNCGKSGQVIKGMNGGQSGANPTWVISGNAFNFDGADTSAAEATGDDEEPVKESVAGIVTFTDAANGNFSGNVLLPAAATAAATALGDPRWTITYANAPEKLYVIGDMNNWDRTALTEMTFNAETKAFEFEFAPDKFTSFAFATKQMTADEATADPNWEDFNANYRYSIGEGDNVAELNKALALLKVNGTVQVKPVKEGTTYKISIAWDLSTVTIAGEAAPEPEPVSVDKLFVMGTGTPKGWDGTTELTFNETTQAFEYVATVTEDTYLTFGDAEWTSWADFNGKHRFAPAEGNTDAVLDQAVQLVLVNDGCVVLKNAGTYKISVTKDLKMTITSTGTGINSIAADKMKNATIYTIGGQRVEKAQKGLYIINGKKVVIK